jgi:DNA-binding CsgD family transcriptional regulator
MNKYEFTKRESQVAKLMMEGKSNKQIASILKISVSTVEFHLTRVYSKLVVSSRPEAMMLLGHLEETLVLDEMSGSMIDKSSGESPVENTLDRKDNEIEPSSTTQRNQNMKSPTGKIFGNHSKAIFITFIIPLVAFATIVGIYLISPKFENIYTRECEHPDSFSVGYTIDRSNASGKNVHGQFGSMNISPWSSKPGFVLYKNISLPNVDRLYLKLLYSKKSPSSVPI